MKPGNIDADIDATASAESVLELVKTKNVRIERIVSTGQATPTGQWLNQDRDEFVILLRGTAGLWFMGDALPQVVKPGDYVSIPANRRHRVAWTAPDTPTVWLAVHYDA